MSKHIIEFPAQLDSFRTRKVTSDAIVGLSVDQLYVKNTTNLIEKIGSEYIVIMIDVTEHKPDEGVEDPMKDRFMKKLHAMIGEYGDLAGLDRDTARSAIKTLMIENGLIEESMSEAGYKELAKACNLVDKLINEYGKSS